MAPAATNISTLSELVGYLGSYLYSSNLLIKGIEVSRDSIDVYESQFDDIESGIHGGNLQKIALTTLLNIIHISQRKHTKLPNEGLVDKFPSFIILVCFTKLMSTVNVIRADRISPDMNDLDP